MSTPAEIIQDQKNAKQTNSWRPSHSNQVSLTKGRNFKNAGETEPGNAPFSNNTGLNRDISDNSIMRDKSQGSFIHPDLGGEVEPNSANQHSFCNPVEKKNTNRNKQKLAQLQQQLKDISNKSSAKNKKHNGL